MTIRNVNWSDSGRQGRVEYAADSRELEVYKGADYTGVSEMVSISVRGAVLWGAVL